MALHLPCSSRSQNAHRYTYTLSLKAPFFLALLNYLLEANTHSTAFGASIHVLATFPGPRWHDSLSAPRAHWGNAAKDRFSVRIGAKHVRNFHSPNLGQAPTNSAPLLNWSSNTPGVRRPMGIPHIRPSLYGVFTSCYMVDVGQAPFLSTLGSLLSHLSLIIFILMSPRRAAWRFSVARTGRIEN